MLPPPDVRDEGGETLPPRRANPNASAPIIVVLTRPRIEASILYRFPNPIFRPRILGTDVPGCPVLPVGDASMFRFLTSAALGQTFHHRVAHDDLPSAAIALT
jgi:hypothetical protein